MRWRRPAGCVTVQTVGPGEMAGFSWLLGPHRWQFDGRAVGRVHAVELDGTCLRAKCDADPRLGYELMQRFARLATRRLQATRLQLLDVYGHAQRWLRRRRAARGRSRPRGG